ncbi:facilitated trehalose transporter Tret1-like [Bradysia coprophila]|uniref:facilitated trehalose transporter Tret1-like n=1 Tax=Bradysia coprophila TaxID=38358 RepID=UPI00187D81DB|nr:facilitated trehalose transporter Tret1-like [Bradysia coprophila]
MKLPGAYASVDFRHVKNQYIAVFWANMCAISYGNLIGWLSPSLLLLLSQNSPIDTGPINTTQASWLGSISYLGGFFGTFIFLVIIKLLGRKIAFCILAIPYFLFWLTVVLANRLEFLYAARVIAGIAGGGTSIAIPLFVSEIADDTIRGMLGSMLMVFACFGILLAYVTGSYMTYKTAPYVMMVFPAALFASFAFLPDTPMSLMSRNKAEAAERSLKFYKNCTGGSKQDIDRFETEKAKLYSTIKANQEKGEKLVWADFTTKEARVGIARGLCVVLLSIFCGSPVLLNYASILFANSGSGLDPSLSAIVMITIQLIATATSSSLVDRIGRRILYILSSGGTAIGMAAMGTYVYLSFKGTDLTGFDWVPVTSLSFAVLSCNIGLIPLVFVVLLEVLPAKIRTVAATLCLSLISFFMFLMVKFYPIIAEAVNMHSCMWFFALVSVSGVIFAIFFLEETKGKSINT